jgi:chaperonin GroEL (HSP60 family)
MRKPRILLKHLHPDSVLQPLAHERVPRPDIYVDGKPLLVLDRRTIRRTKKDVLSEHLAVADFMRDLATTILGPKRLTKLLLIDEGKSRIPYITSDLYSVLKRIQLKHPVAQLIAGAGITTYREKGDGCTCTVLLATSILRACKQLLNRKTHPNTVIDGLQLSYQKVMKCAPRLAVRTTYDTLRTVEIGIRSSLAGKIQSNHNSIAKLLIAAVEIVGIGNLAGTDADHAIYTRTITGGSLADSEVVNGIALTQEIPHMRMPRRVIGAKIALIQGELRLPDKINRYQDYKIEFKDAGKLGNLRNDKRLFLESLVARVVEAKPNVVLVQAGVDDDLFEYFANRGILLIRRFPQVEFERVSRVVGGNMVPDPSNFSAEDLGWADSVEERRVGKNKLIFITGCKSPKTVDIILRGWANEALNDVERAMKGAIKAAVTVVKDPRLVWGGGAFEQELATILNKYSLQIPDRRQLVVKAVAEAFESIPAMLGETVGLKGMETTTELRRRHARGEISAGVNADGNSIGLMSSCGIMDSLDVKLQVIKSAFETAMTILRIDDIVVGPKLSEPEQHYLQRVKGTKPEKLKEKGVRLEV